MIDRSGFRLPTWMLADREWGSMTCHEKLMYSFFLLTQEVTTADVTHLAHFMGTGIHFPLERLCYAFFNGS